MNIIDKIRRQTGTKQPLTQDDLNRYKMHIENLSKDKDIFSYTYPNLTEKDIAFIKKMIYNHKYSKKVKPLAIQLAQYVGVESLLYLALNLYDIKLFRGRKFVNHGSYWSIIDGQYMPVENLIIYNNKEALSHELIHLSSNAKNTKLKTYHLGFSYCLGDKTFFRALNEGFTELLCRRIFHNSDYKNADSYKLNIYFARLLELLYENQKDAEQDYFKANFLGPINNFTKFSTLEHYHDLCKQLDSVNYINDTEKDLELLKPLNDVIKKTDDAKKIDKANEITEEYLESTNKITTKIFTKN